MIPYFSIVGEKIFSGLLPSETVPIICRFAECCPVLSIRGTAFWVLNLIGNTKLG